MCNTRGRTAEIAARPFLRLKPKEEFPLQQMSGTLTNLVIYLALVVLGLFPQWHELHPGRYGPQ